MAALRSTHATLAKRLAALTAASALVLAVGQSAPPAHEHAALAAPAAQATATTASTYTKNWDTFAISDPLPQASDASLEIFVHTRNLLAGLGPMVIEHGPHCEAPPATHMSSDPMSFSQAVFLCSAANPHLMTAINSGDYGVIYLTPAALADFSGGEAVVRFDVSTLRTSARDWIDLWVTPLDDAMPGPLDSQFPDLQGPPRRGLHSRMDPFYGSVFRSERFDNHAITSIGGGWPPLESVLTSTSASRRDTFEARITRTSFRLSIQQAGTTTWTVLSDGTFPALDWSKGVIQFGHHSYNPTKDCEPGAVCLPNTWHWDNISISPSQPLTMIPANETIRDAANPTYTFNQPAPPNSFLMVNMRASTAEVSLDHGATWATLTRQATERDVDGHARPFRHPIPAGTTSAMLRGSTAYSGPWLADHAAIWSESPLAVPPTPNPGSTPPTATPVPPTSTVAPTSTSAPTSTATPLPSPTSTPPPSPTAMPTNSPSPTAIPATATPAPLGNCAVTVAPNAKSGSWSCP